MHYQTIFLPFAIGIVIALIFVGLPFVVRTVQPVMEEIDREVEEAVCAAANAERHWPTMAATMTPLPWRGWRLLPMQPDLVVSALPVAALVPYAENARTAPKEAAFMKEYEKNFDWDKHEKQRQRNVFSQ